jgi:hypothetical protein
MLKKYPEIFAVRASEPEWPVLGIPYVAMGRIGRVAIHEQWGQLGDLLIERANCMASV